MKHTTDTLVDLRYRGETLTTTPNHPFWSAPKRDWIPAGELRVGDVVLASDGLTIPIESIEIRRGHFTVYNLEIEDTHNYFAGKNQRGVKGTGPFKGVKGRE